MCTTAKHEREKSDPVMLAKNYDAHAEDWHLGGEVLRLWTCRRCKSTVAVLVTE